MAGRFLPQRDRDFLERINTELIGDLRTENEGIINQKIVIYKISAYDTSTNMYGEAVGGKNFKQGVQLACIVEASDFDYNTDEFGPDAQQDSQFHILRQTLLDLSLTPEIGDIVEWNYGFFEVNGDQIKPIGAEKVNRFFDIDLDKAYTDRIVAAVDPFN